MRVTVIPIVVGALGTVPEKDWNSGKSEEESRTSRLTHVWDRPEYREESSLPVDTCCLLDSSESLPANVGMKKSQVV